MSTIGAVSLQERFKGQLVRPGDSSYDDLREVFNGMVDRRPELIIRCVDTGDVVEAVRLAREAGLPLAVYGGGHGVTGNAVCDGGVVVDLRQMKGIEIDLRDRTCRAGAGLTWGELDAATQEHAVVVTGGRVSTTGISGLVLGSGSGWIERKFGYTADNLLSVETVTADGSVVTASERENPDLFWGTRGGGGNFGIVTSFEFRLHRLGPTVLGGMLIYPGPMAPDVLRGFRDFMAEAPDEVGAGCALVTAPHEEFVPLPARGQPEVGVVLCYAGPVEQGEAVLAPLREFGPPALDMVEPMPYVAVQRLIDSANPRRLRNYWSADFLRGLPDACIEALCECHLSKASPLSEIIVLPGGGAVARVPDDRMAFGQRGAPFNVHVLSKWADPAEDEENIAWARGVGSAIEPYATGSAYLNFIGDEGEERVRAAFGPDVYARLQALKRRYDPGNLFRQNQNIRPSAP
jgi:FAD/FMN-containing dehydrogenase